MKYLQSILEALILSTVIIYSALVIPSVHRHLLKWYVGKRVVMITNPTDNGAIIGLGTGSIVKLPSGKNAILTNAHVCALKNDHDELDIISPLYDRPIRKKIIEISNFTDLCLIEPIEGISGLTLGQTLSIGDEVYTQGHPMGMDETMSQGDIVSEDWIQIPEKEITTPEEEASCNKPKNQVLTVPGWFGTMEKLCMVNVLAYSSTVPTFPGNSGSPMFDWRGRMIGVVFAGSRATNWGFMINLEDVKKFIASY